MTDYHDFTWPDCTPAWRGRFDTGDIYINAAMCLLCGWFIRSKNRHDFVTCECGNVSVDGGSWYCKRSYKTKEYEDIIVPFNNIQEIEDE